MKNNPSIEHLLLIEGRSAQAILDEHFTEETPFVDLNKIDRSKLDDYLYHNVILPPSLQSYIDGATEELTRNEVHSLETALEKHYSIKDPYYICLRPQAKQSTPTFYLSSEND